MPSTARYNALRKSVNNIVIRKAKNQALDKQKFYEGKYYKNGLLEKKHSKNKLLDNLLFHPDLML